MKKHFVLGLALLAALALLAPTTTQAAKEGNGAKAPETHILFFDQGCTVSVTCNDDGTVDLSAKGCTEDQAKKAAQLAVDLC